MPTKVRTLQEQLDSERADRMAAEGMRDQLREDLRVIQRWAAQQAAEPPDRASEGYTMRIRKGQALAHGHRPVYYQLIACLMKKVLDGTFDRKTCEVP